MENTKEFTIAVLKDLLQNCLEEQSLFKRASLRISDPKIIQKLENYADDKYISICKLETEIKRLGGKVEKTENDQNISEKPNIKGDYDINKILLECVNKDTITLNKYSSAIKEEILWEVIPLVAKQFVETQNMHDNLMSSFWNYQQVQINTI